MALLLVLVRSLHAWVQIIWKIYTKIDYITYSDDFIFWQKAAIEGGLIRLNGKPVTPDRVICNQDFLQSRVHRHEPPVSGEPLTIIEETQDFIVINKPSSIPVSALFCFVLFFQTTVFSPKVFYICECLAQTSASFSPQVSYNCECFHTKF